MPTSGQSPLVATFRQHAAAVAQGADAEVALFEAPFDGTVTSVTYTPEAAITGANTDTRKVEVYNRKQDGTGTVQVALLQFNSGVNAAKWDEKDITLVTADVAQGDILSFKSTHVGAGLADPGGNVQVEFTRS
jgi:hypothetical protein